MAYLTFGADSFNPEFVVRFHVTPPESASPDESQGETLDSAHRPAVLTLHFISGPTLVLHGVDAQDCLKALHGP
jgi:hypothetical protein